MPSSTRARSISGLESQDSPERAVLPRNHSVKAFLPMLTDESVFSTRGQHLPTLISHLSSSIKDRVSLSRRGSYFVGPSEPPSPTDGVAGDDFRRREGSSVVRPSLLGTGALTTDGNSWSNGLEQGDMRDESRRLSEALLNTSQMRSMRLIGKSNPRYRWEQYWKSDEELKKMKKPIRQYYERNNMLIQQYVFIDRLLDSSLPHDLIQEYQYRQQAETAVNIPTTITEELGSGLTPPAGSSASLNSAFGIGSPDSIPNGATTPKIKRTPKNLYKIPDESTPLMRHDEEDEEHEALRNDSSDKMPQWEPEEETDLSDRIVTIAIYINFAANAILLVLKIIVTVMTSSVSVLAALVDAILDFLSTAIVWGTTRLISTSDDYGYPVGRRRLEPIGVLVFSVIMITSFFQVGLEGFSRLNSSDHIPIELGYAAIAIMATTVVIKGLCWFWCRLIKNSGVQALAQDAATDVVFNTFSIIFPLVGYYANIWYLDPLGGILLSIYVILAWSRTTATHIKNLSGAAASADERNILLYLTMRFAKSIKQIQGLQAYHAGDKLNVEVDIVLDENTSLRDAHDLGESLQYVLEGVPTVDRAFVHLDYTALNLPTHMKQSD